MPKFGKTSRERLSSCHEDLQLLFEIVVRRFDCSVIEGHRDKDTQDKYFREGKSKLRYPDSKHNSYPSLAIDVAPWPIDWNDIGRFYMFVGYVKRVAEELDLKIRCGADWDGDYNTDDQRFNDLVHFELL